MTVHTLKGLMDLLSRYDRTKRQRAALTASREAPDGNR